MAIQEYRDPSGPNDALASALGPNDHSSNLAAARAASVAAEKAKREAADKTASEFKAKAARDADDLATCRAEIVTLKAQLQEAQQLANTSKAQSSEARSTTEVLQHNLTTKSNELATARAEIENLKSNSSGLSNRVSELSSSKEQLQSQLNQRTAERDYNWSELNKRTSERDHNWSELQQRTSELDNGDVTVRQITWGGRDLTNDGNIARKVKERVRNGWGIPFSNDFFGCDPQPGTKKWGVVRFCRSRKVEGWEYEEKSSVP
ncbi:hypothetical protein FSARC_14388 [Fusarium sarcochroum]|uniref:Uncharacterized protein n=1 Tax=Fusarium sarcochroum TaxID=1208366 RepID=A0A8H4STX3_9HYPO|nr:hypothetical protein FSARC_14388 [Fusarium sarcochroum]